MKAVMIHLKENQIKRLQKEKEQTGCSVASQVRTALSEFWRQRDATQ
jgi:hypothetical protein